jgi:hypothetical protein
MAATTALIIVGKVFFLAAVCIVLFAIRSTVRTLRTGTYTWQSGVNRKFFIFVHRTEHPVAYWLLAALQIGISSLITVALLIFVWGWALSR